MRRRALLLVSLVVLVPLLGAQCFPRQCRGPQNCERVCECLEAGATQTTFCNAFFPCDAQTGVCVDDYNSSCDEICNRFFANGRCGSLACDSNAQCVREAGCGIADENGAPICEFGCARTFACDQGTCEAGFAQDDATICAQPECANLACDVAQCAPACQ